MNSKCLGCVSVVVVFISALQGCSKSGGAGLNLPLFTPPVKAAAPKAFGGGTARAGHLDAVTDFFPGLRDTINPSDFATRFFSAGPSDIYGILGAIDSRIQGINSQSAGSSAPCLTQTPVAYNITPYGQTVPMFGQCYQSVGTNGFVQWGVKDGATYLWVQIGAGNIAAIATPVAATRAAAAATAYTVQAWATVGNAGIYNSNGTTSANWSSIGSYGVMQIQSDSSKTHFEMTAAGTGLGYCGAHFISDGTDIFGEGSTDMGATCNTSASICVLAADGTTPVGSCTVSATNYVLTSIGRIAAVDGATHFGVSQYPAVANITLDGTSTDSLAFGPTTPTTGVGQFGGASSR